MPSSSSIIEKPSIKVSLLNHSDKFAPGSQELFITKKVNFIFGKNGTGKTTISDEILYQLSDDYDVRVFKDFDGIVENGRLNAVSLGTENAKIQNEIDTVDKNISEIEKQINKPEDQTVDNLFTKSKKAYEVYTNQKNKIDTFFTNSARTIKNKSNPQIAKPSYDKTSFQGDIKHAVLLNEGKIAECKDTIKADKKADVASIYFPDVDLTTYLDNVNEINKSSVAQTIDIPELADNPNKQNFARQGMNIHEHKTGEICAFCGNRITAGRWQLLGNYFNDEVKKLERRIAGQNAKIISELDAIQKIKEIKKEEFYDKFEQEIINLNLQISVKRGEYRDFLKLLQIALEKKSSNLFVEIAPLEIAVPPTFKDIEQACKNLTNKHNELSLNLTTEQSKAKDALRYQEVKKFLDEFKYEEENLELTSLKAASEETKKNLQDKICELQLNQESRKALILSTRDEEKIAKKINKLLSGMGVGSFSLRLIEDKDENQKGQYQIESYDKSIRPITQLSKGEKNIIAFLYFIFSLESIDSKNMPKIIVFDDPMTSNDDTMQYLMIGEIQKLYRKLKEGNYFVLLTHNCHFYLNVRPNMKKHAENGKEISFYDKYGVFHLFSNGKQTTIKCISKGKDDFKTSYETLWNELVFLYDSRADSELMLSPCRRICETYMNFTKKGIEGFYGDNINAKKLFDVNQHSIDDFEAEANGKTGQEIIDILYQLFTDNGAKEHMDSYWRTGES